VSPLDKIEKSYLESQIAYVGQSRGLRRVWRCIVAAWRCARRVK